MFYAYVLKSEKNGTHYYGHTHDLGARLKQHNFGKVKYSKPFRPWRLIYKESFETKSEAYKREIFFKSIGGYKFLKENGVI